MIREEMQFDAPLLLAEAGPGEEGEVEGEGGAVEGEERILETEDPLLSLHFPLATLQGLVEVVPEHGPGTVEIGVREGGAPGASSRP